MILPRLTSTVTLENDTDSVPSAVVIEHAGDIYCKSGEKERAAYIEDINHVAEALHKAFHPQKVNYGAYGDTGHHLHFHLVPKYTDGYEWGGTFAMNPGEKFLSDEEYAALIEEIKKYL